MSIVNALTSLFGRYSFGQHADQALALTQPSAPAAPEPPSPGCAADTSPLRLIPGVGDTAGRAPDPTPRGAAGHPSQWPVDNDQARDELNVLRILCGALADTCADVIECIDQLDPTPAALAQAAADART